MNEDRIIIAAIKSWNIANADKMRKRCRGVHIFTRKEDLTFKKVKAINPLYIFFPHWSWKIPEEIYKNYECVVFHMTDLPFKVVRIIK